VPNPYSRKELLILEEPNIFDLRTEALGPYNPPIINLSMPIIVQALPYECLVVSPTTMEEKTTTSSGNIDIPFTTLTIGGVPPLNQPSLVLATMVSTVSTSGSGLIPYMLTITAPFLQNTTDSPFSYEMLGFSTSTVISSSTLQTLCLGVGRSITHLQRYIGGTSTPFIIFPYDMGHICYRYELTERGGGESVSVDY
jgi:hypothetical protein